MTPARLSGWGRFPVERCHVFRPERRVAVAETLASKAAPTFIARGLGRSYGDAALNADGGVIVHDRLDRMLEFDAESGVLRCEAGTSLADIIEVWLPRGWFLPVTPGTKHVTVGGAIAADVHGKNHHRDGTLAAFVEDLTLLTADGEMLRCSRDERSDVFWATVGGMGLTGMILDARLRLRPVESAWIHVDDRRSRDLEETLALVAATDTASRYSVAWVDCLARGRATGRAVVMSGDHAAAAELRGRGAWTRPRRRTVDLPIDLPTFTLSPIGVGVFNAVYYATHSTGERRLVDLERFFYPLDVVVHWNRLYGRRGFVQYQAVLPPEEASRGLAALVERLAHSRHPSFLTTLKRFGPANPGFLSFPHEGYTIAFDIPVRPGLVEFLHELDRLVVDRGGRVYLAKDATMTPATFRAMYPRLDDFRVVQARLDPRGVLSSSLGRRLGIVGRR